MAFHGQVGFEISKTSRKLFLKWGSFSNKLQAGVHVNSIQMPTLQETGE